MNQVHVRPEFKTNNKFLILLYKIAAFLVSIPLIFIYVPLRWVARFLAKFILWVPRFVTYIIRDVKEMFQPKNRTKEQLQEIERKRKEKELRKENEQPNRLTSILASIKKFLLYVIEPHPYKGTNSFVMYIEIHTTGEKVSAQHNRNFIFFLVPALGAFILIVIVPFLMGLYYSLTDWTGLNNGSEVFVGLDNYSNIFSDYKFVYSFMRTSLYSILNVIVINTVAFSLALLVTQNLKLKNVYRAGFFIPNLIGGLVLGYIWQFIYLNVFPAVADTVPFIGNFLDHSLIGQRASAGEAMGALIGVVTWQYAGYIMMIYIAALQNVPQDLIEASKIDGANSFQRLRTIIFPLVAQAFTISLFLTLVTSFKQYDTVYALTQGGPTNLIPTWLANFMDEPFYKTVETLDLMANNIYQTAFGYGEMGIGQAKAIIFFIILMLVSIAQVTYSQKREVEL